MPAFTEYFCGLCNPSCQRREVGDEVNTGYVRVPLEMGKPSSWSEFIGDRGVEYACGRCEGSKERFGSTLEQRHPALATVAELVGTPPGTTVRRPGVTAVNTESGWPARTSPFEQAGPVERPVDTDVRADGE